MKSGREYISFEDASYVYIDVKKVQDPRKEKEWIASLNQKYQA
jgi:hypothetical protein